MLCEPKLWLTVGSGSGAQFCAWRWPGVNPKGWVDFDTLIRHAQMAERGKFHLLFMPDFQSMRGDTATDPQQVLMEPMMTLASVARGT